MACTISSIEPCTCCFLYRTYSTVYESWAMDHHLLTSLLFVMGL